jgi:hypothetical protein
MCSGGWQAHSLGSFHWLARGNRAATTQWYWEEFACQGTVYRPADGGDPVISQLDRQGRYQLEHSQHS